MWFKNLQIYRLPAPWAIDLAKLDEQLARGGFAKCASHEPMSRGWVRPRKDGALIYANNRFVLLSLAVEQRLLPSSVVNDEVRERAEKITEEQGYAPGRKALRELKERVTEELMPRAFTRKRTTFVWIDPQNGWFVVDAGAQGKAEEVIEHLRFCLDEFPLQLLHTQLSPQAAMADWLAGGEGPAGFTIDRDCELKAIGEEKSAVRYVRHPLDTDEVKAHLTSGKMPTRLAMTWKERVSFTLTDTMQIKGIKFLDVVFDGRDKPAKDEAFDVDAALATGELSQLIPDLITGLGGELDFLGQSAKLAEDSPKAAPQSGSAPSDSSEPAPWD